ncbi:15-hydroxyprostaglandin dehydrogenase [NAD(+)]-like [Vanessa atalanta]|uniref:15-hydroxyprostaglandin dehydrogenase [NAD(+)]-like n=1 Tax=Vanessa atalanta TaxID=42275 RepID=UPI001FCD3635|nr:15-hydroxyprostaglandin dehydrogenase [NAD(+)]-like [Vanessa atalanta]
MFDIRNKVVLITGGSIGIGAKVIEFLLDENVKHVANLDIAEDKGIALQNQLNKKYGVNKVKFIKGDVTNQDDLFGAYQTTIKDHGYIDIVINNAGIMNDAKDKYKKEIEVNVTALVSSTLKAMDMMRKDEGGKGGVVMNMSSIAALYQDPLIPIYFGTKSAVLQFSNCIGLPEYYDRTGVRVLAICFGATDTSLLSKEKLGNFDKIVEKKMLDNISNHRLQKAESAARGVVDAIKQGESGSTWLSIADKPVKDVTSTIKKAYGILSELVYEQ